MHNGELCSNSGLQHLQSAKGSVVIIDVRTTCNHIIVIVISMIIALRHVHVYYIHDVHIDVLCFAILLSIRFMNVVLVCMLCV